MKLTGKIGRISLNNASKKLFEFGSNVFCRFKDHFFKVLATDVMADGLPLMFKSNPTKFKSFDEDLLTFVERVDKAILEQLLASLDAWTILSLPLANDSFTALDGKVPYLVLFCV